MATNLVYRNTDSQNRVETLAATYAPGAPVVSLGGLPAVTVTGSGDYTRSETIPGVGTLSGIPAGGVGLAGKEVTLAFDGTWEFDKDAFGGTLPTTNIAQGNKVYITSGGALTNTAGSNTLFGYYDYPKDYDKTRGFLPIRIGAL
jgi:predicted RecA/RadA family phage recombinase